MKSGLPPEVVLPTSREPGFQRARSGAQLGAVLRKNWLLKKRAWKTTCAEIFSPPLFLSLLVLGYTLSDNENFTAGIYAATNLEIGPIISALAPLAAGVGSGINLGETVQGIADSTLTSSNGTLRCGSTSGSGCDGSSEFDLLSVRRSLSSIINGPLPVLSVDAFLAVGLSVRDSLSAEDRRLLREYETYLQLFGNILTPGNIHIAPDSPTVRDFVNRSRTRHPTLQAIRMIVHRDEAAALRVLQGGTPGEHTWGLLSFHELDPQHLNYSIRLNYSTVPNTNRLARWIARGLDTKYQRWMPEAFEP